MKPLTSDHRALLTRRFRELSPLSDEELTPFYAVTKAQDFAKGAYYCQSGHPVTNFGVVLEGLFRVHYDTEAGDAPIRRFAEPGFVIGDLASLLTRSHAQVSTEAIEPSCASMTPFEVLRDLYDKVPNWQRFGRLLAERYFTLLEQQIYRFAVLSAKERYQLFRSENPGLEQRLSKTDVARYLGITPQSFSRLLGTRR